MRPAVWVVAGFIFVFAIIFGRDGNRVRAAFDEPVPCAGLPALTGDVANSAGSCSTTSTWHKIGATQVASNAASIQWTGLATYNDYFISCSGVYPVTTGQMLWVQVGEGGTPTWKTSGYVWSSLNNNSGGSTPGGSASASDSGFNIAANNQGNTATSAATFVGTIHNIVSTTSYTEMNWEMNGSTSTVNYYLTGGGSYPADTTAKTAIRVIVATGNLNGTCALWGML